MQLEEVLQVVVMVALHDYHNRRRTTLSAEACVQFALGMQGLRPTCLHDVVGDVTDVNSGSFGYG